MDCTVFGVGPTSYDLYLLFHFFINPVLKLSKKMAFITVL